jgi:predicted SprT family Zn-dependent metalloprotease
MVNFIDSWNRMNMNTKRLILKYVDSYGSINTIIMLLYELLNYSLDEDGPAQDQNWMGKPNDITENPKFKAWFAGSKVVDDHGRPLRVYHGTPRGGFTLFNKRHISTDDYSKAGFFFSDDPAEATLYSNPESEDKYPAGAAVYPVYLVIKRPYQTTYDKLQDAKNRFGSLDVYIKRLIPRYDGLVIPTVDGNHYVAFRAGQIKSATGNNGNFDPKSNKITENNSQVQGRMENPIEDKTTSKLLTKNTYGIKQAKVGNRKIYHGTSFYGAISILKDNSIDEGCYWNRKGEPHGPRFTYSFDAAKTFAIEPLMGLDQNGVVFELDGEKINKKYTLVKYKDTDCKGNSWSVDEQEVVPITEHVSPVIPYITGIYVIGPLDDDTIKEYGDFCEEEGRIPSKEFVDRYKRMISNPKVINIKNEGYGGINIGNNGNFDPKSNKITESATPAVSPIKLNQIIAEYMQLLKPGLPTPNIKLVNQRSSPWLAVDELQYGKKDGEYFYGDNTTIYVQKKVLSNEEATRRVIAHELCHHEIALTYEKEQYEKLGYGAFKFWVRGQGHGNEWQALANKFNAKYGDKFVTVTSDASYEYEDDSKYFLAILGQDEDNIKAYGKCFKITPAFIKKLTNNYGMTWKIVETNSSVFSRVSGGKLFVAVTEKLDALRDEWLHGKVVLTPALLAGKGSI